jgi:hypothetical protein
LPAPAGCRDGRKGEEREFMMPTFPEAVKERSSIFRNLRLSRKIEVFFPLLAMMILLSAALPWPGDSKEPSREEAYTYSNSQHRIRLTLPRGWSFCSVAGESVLAGFERSDTFVGSISAKGTPAAGDIDGYCREMMENLRDSAEDRRKVRDRTFGKIDKIKVGGLEGRLFMSTAKLRRDPRIIMAQSFIVILRTLKKGTTAYELVITSGSLRNFSRYAGELNSLVENIAFF